MHPPVAYQLIAKKTFPFFPFYRKNMLKHWRKMCLLFRQNEQKVPIPGVEPGAQPWEGWMLPLHHILFFSTSLAGAARPASKSKSTWLEQFSSSFRNTTRILPKSINTTPTHSKPTSVNSQAKSQHKLVFQNTLHSQSHQSSIPKINQLKSLSPLINV